MGSNWEKALTCFQASARGHLVRKEIRRAREDFEDIVKEIDGGLTHVLWKEAVISIPHFTDNNGPVLRPSYSVYRPARSGASPSSERASLSGDRDHRAQPQKTEAERDDSLTKVQPSLFKNYSPSCSVTGNAEGRMESTVANKDGGLIESTGDSTTVWSSMELDMNYESHQYSLAQEVPCTPEALRLHRNTLTMELLWLQQAIDSRKKYLSLKNRLSTS